MAVGEIQSKVSLSVLCFRHCSVVLIPPFPVRKRSSPQLDAKIAPLRWATDSYRTSYKFFAKENRKFKRLRELHSFPHRYDILLKTTRVEPLV